MKAKSVSNKGKAREGCQTVEMHGALGLTLKHNRKVTVPRSNVVQNADHINRGKSGKVRSRIRLKYGTRYLAYSTLSDDISFKAPTVISIGLSFKTTTVIGRRITLLGKVRGALDAHSCMRSNATSVYPSAQWQRVTSIPISAGSRYATGQRRTSHPTMPGIR